MAHYRSSSFCQGLPGGHIGRGRHARHKEIRRAEQQDIHGVRLIEKLMLVIAEFDVPEIGHAEGRSRDRLPKLAQRINATLRRISGYNR
jgi:hypothetical protein